MGKLIRIDIADIDLQKPLKRENTGVLLAEGDRVANRFGANVFRGINPVDLTGYAMKAYFIRPTLDTMTLDGVIDGNTVYIDLPDSCYASEGHYSLALKIIGDDITQTLRVIDGYIRLTETDNEIVPETEVVSLKELLQRIDEVEAAAERAEAAADRAEAAGGGGTGSGTPGQDGEDGFSPVAKVTQTSTGATISITDATGTTTATITNGKDGQDGAAGKDGATGKDGVSPTITASKSGKVTTLTIKDASGTKTATINDGADGAAGKDGSPGADGKDGASVTVKSVSSSTADGGSNVVTFSDGKTLTVKNGSKGSAGAAGKDGAKGDPGEDYVLTEEDKQEIADIVAIVKVAEQPIFAESEDDMTDTSKLYVMSDGYLYRYMQTTITTPGSTNLLTASTTEIKTHCRYSQSSAAFKTGVTNVDSVIIPIPSGDITLRFRGISYGKYSTSDYYPYIYGGKSNTNFTATTFVSGVDKWTPGADGDITITFSNTSGCTHAVMMLEHANMSTGIVTLNEPISEGGTTTTTAWANTGHAYQPQDYEPRIIAAENNINNLTQRVNVLEGKSDLLGMSLACAPANQLPADGSDAADFNADTVLSTDLYAYMDALTAKYPGYITGQTMGKDASGTYDCKRYVLCKSYWHAWARDNYPRMHAWKSGSTIIYSVSVSPRVGDTMYTTKYIGTAKGTVSAVTADSTGATASTRTVGGVVYSRYAEGDVAPSIVYTITRHEGAGDHVYSSSFASTTTIGSVAAGAITCANGITYKRYPYADRYHDKSEPVRIFILANEHGGDGWGDPAHASIVCARMANDLCRNTENEYLRWLKNHALIAMIPIGNPWGYNLHDGTTRGYSNHTNVNINRNYDVPGWALGPMDAGGLGAYPGSEIETQYIMDTIQQARAQVGMSIHVLGNSGGTANPGWCAYQGNGWDTACVDEIAEVMGANYNLELRSIVTDATQDPYHCGKSPAYIQYAGCVGGLIETQYCEYSTGKNHTSLAMESCYTEVLLFIQAWTKEAMGNA